MIMEIYLFLAFLTIFSARAGFFIYGIIKQDKSSTDERTIDEYPFVTVIVPARNEELYIERCVNSISKNNYPTDKYEIIAVDDRSDDATASILNRLKENITNLVVLNKDFVNPLKNLQGKAGAIDYALNFAKGEIIMMTDADCEVNQNWLETFVKAHQDNGFSLVLSFALIKADNFFSKMQEVEWLTMNCMAAAAINLKLPLSCYGNNLSFKKKDYLEIGGYGNIPFSVTEDLALLQAMHKAHKKQKFIFSDKATIQTVPCRTFKEFIKQQHRWTIGGKALGWKAAIFIASSASIWLGLVLSIISSSIFWLALFLCVRVASDIILMFPAILKLKKYNLIKWFVPTIVFFLLMELVAPFFLFFPKVKWKDQVFEQ